MTTPRVWEIDSAQMDVEFTNLPGELARFSELHVEASESAEIADHELDVLEARLSLDIREHAKLLGEKPTVDFIAAKMKVKPEWQAAKRASIQARADEMRAKGIVNAVVAKREMLISLGAHIRAQLQGDPSTRAQNFPRSRGSKSADSFANYSWDANNQPNRQSEPENER